METNPAWRSTAGDGAGTWQASRSPYLLFGGGTHWCIGDQMALNELATMALELLRLPQLRIARRLRYDGLAAASLLVEYGP